MATKIKHCDLDEKGQTRGVIYRYINQSEGEENGWSYVGSTMNEKTRRYSWKNHGNKSYGGKKINDARVKFGIENFFYEVLEEIYDADENALQMKLDEREAFYVQQFDSSQNGYNTSKGGTGNKGVNFSQTHRNSIGEASKGRKHTEATKKQIGTKLKGHSVSDDTRRKISEGNKGKKRTAEQRHAESERLKGKVPEAATQGAKLWVINNGGGYWKNHPLTPEAKQHMKEAQQNRGIKVRVEYSDGRVETYNTMLDAAKGLGIGVGSVNYYINAGKGKWHRNGFKIEKKMSIKHSIIFSGSNPISLDRDEHLIIDDMNKNLERFYFNLVKVVSLNQINTDTLEIIIERQLPLTYLQSGLLNFIDEAIISGMGESSFVLPYTDETVIAPILPLGHCFFSPDKEFYKLYIHLNKICTGETVKRVAITAMTSEIRMTVEFDSRIPHRYRQDITSLTTKYGDLEKLRGQTISTTLQDFSAICQRDNPKIASYSGLGKFLKSEYNITLNIKSQKTK